MWAMIEKLRMCAWSAMSSANEDRRRGAVRSGASGYAAASCAARAPASRPIGSAASRSATATPSRPIGLDAVERAVRAAQERAVRLVRPRHRDPDRHRHAESRLRDGRTQPGPGLERLVRVGDRQQGGELVAADPEQRVAAAQGAAERGGDRAEDLVAVLVAVGVVDALEAVEVDDDDRGLRAAVRPGEGLVEGRVVAEPGERVGGGALAQRAHQVGGAQARRGVGGEQLEELDVLDRDRPLGAAGEQEDAARPALRDERDGDEGADSVGPERHEARVGRVVAGMDDERLGASPAGWVRDASAAAGVVQRVPSGSMAWRRRGERGAEGSDGRGGRCGERGAERSDAAASPAWRPASAAGRTSAADSSPMRSMAAARTALAIAAGSSSADRLVMWRSIRCEADSAGGQPSAAISSPRPAAARRTRSRSSERSGPANRTSSTPTTQPSERIGKHASPTAGAASSRPPESSGTTVSTSAVNVAPTAPAVSETPTRPGRSPMPATHRRRPPRSSQMLVSRPMSATRRSATV